MWLLTSSLGICSINKDNGGLHDEKTFKISIIEVFGFSMYSLYSSVPSRLHNSSIRLFSSGSKVCSASALNSV